MSNERIDLLTLPAEIQHCILASLIDVRSLASAALVCRAFYSTFKSDKESLIRDVLINCVGYNILPEALIAHQCSPPYLSVQVERAIILPEDRLELDRLHDYASEFLKRLKRPAVTTIICTMRDAITISDFHLQVVSVLTQRFIQACARAAPIHLPLEHSLRSRPASPSEEDRIARTLYRFETFRRLFGCFCTNPEHPVHWTDEEPLLHYTLIFFSKFAPWENAQLGCINDFLAREVMPAFNDLAEHDVVWGKHYVDFKATIRCPTIQHLMTLGLERILEIATCDSYVDRETLLKVEDMPPGENEAFLGTAITNICELSPLEGDGKAILEASPFCADIDVGAEQMWRLSLTNKSNTSFAIHAYSDWASRQWGYVLWDYDRLKALDALDRPLAEEQEPFSLSIPEDVTASWEAREAIYRRGGRGYWAKDDESRIVWPRRRRTRLPPPPGPKLP